MPKTRIREARRWMMIRKSPIDISNQQDRLKALVVRGNEFLCIEGKAGIGSWGDARVSSTSLWSICECGVRDLHPQFVRYCLERLLSCKDAIQQEDALCFNREIWDSSLVLIALAKGGRADFADAIVRIKKWVLDEAMDNSWDAEPWETLWAITSLLTVGTELYSITPLIKKCIKWVLDRRNANGILISTHYMGFLLSTLNEIVKYLKVNPKERSSLDDAINQSLRYLHDEFVKCQKRGTLWEDEPWIIGHVLLGLVGTEKSRDAFLLDPEFNEYMIRWYESQEWLPGRGWQDLVETSFTLIGLTNYYVEREAQLQGISEAGKAEIRQKLARDIRFRFDPAEMPVEMTVRPRWRGRAFKTDPAGCFILMPYRTSWSPGIHLLLREILDAKKIEAKRADDIKRQDVMEDVWRGINEARIIIADCTGLNPNVLYEVGIAHTIGKDVILLTQDIQSLPFDLRTLRSIEYTNDDQGYRKLRDEIPKTIDQIFQG